MPVSFWQPGKLYPQNSVVQPNESGEVSQIDLYNGDFEAGDSGWTLGSGFAINSDDAFQGTFSAEYAGSGGGTLVFATQVFNALVYATQDGENFDANDQNFGYVAANNDVFVGIQSDDVWLSSDGSNWTENTGTEPWAEFTVFSNLLYDPTTELFYLFELESLAYYTSPDGVNWTTRALPSSAGSANDTRDMATNGSITVITRSNDTILSTTDGANWTLRSSAVSEAALTYVSGLGKFFAIEDISHGVYESANGISWSAVGSSNLASILGAADVISVANNGSLLVAMVNTITVGATTDMLATSPDGETWTLRNSFGGAWVTYSNALGKFAFASPRTTVAAGQFNSSADGVTWEQDQYASTIGVGLALPGRAAEKLNAPTAVNAFNLQAGQVFPGQTIRARCVIKSSAGSSGRVGLAWYDNTAQLIKTNFAPTYIAGASSVWRESSVSAVAPPGAASVTVVIQGLGNSGEVRFDNVVWDYYYQDLTCGLLFKATQTGSAYSGNAEPVWPLVVGQTVVDNGVTWEAVQSNCVMWQAFPILESGNYEPTWPLAVDGTVADNTILWVAEDQRVKDSRCPNTKTVAIAASKIFAGDDDIVAYSATVNPLDWSTANDAGYIPFGLNTHGSQPVSALGIYRSNLVCFNSKAFQMWQVDEDPANFAILDAVPVGCPYYKSPQPVSNDLVFLTEAGIRSMGIAGASTNLQAGMFGKQVDPLVKDLIALGIEPVGLYYPGAGQYWLLFGDTAMVLTMNGGSSDTSWSRYEFPAEIEAWTIRDKTLYLRAGDEIWQLSEDAIYDRQVGNYGDDFEGWVTWPYLDFGALGTTKSMIGFDVVADGSYSVSIGYNQNNLSHATTPYTIGGDTVPGDIIPLPVSAPSFQMRLVFEPGQAWEWSATTLYLQDFRSTS